MKNLTIFDVRASKAALVYEQSMKAIPFLIKNEPLVVLSDMQIKNIKDAKSYSATPIHELFSHIVINNDLNDFLIMDFSDYKDNIPEVLFLLDNIAVDGYYLDKNIPDKYKKAWINITSVTGKKNPVTDELNIVDIPKLHSLFVRSYLTMNYHDSEDMWLTPNLIIFIIESYSMTIARLLQRTFNLNPEEFLFVQTLFAIFYAQRLTTHVLQGNIPAPISRCGFLGSMLEIYKRIENLKLEQDKLLSIHDIIFYIQENGPKRMSKLEYSHLYRLFVVGSVDSMSSGIALEFPPYWVFQLLKLASGVKHPVLSNIFRTDGNLKQKLNDFVKNLLITNTLEVNR